MLIDISRPLEESMAIYPANPPFSLQKVQEATSGQSALSLVSFGSHTGTHIDAPAHIAHGASGIEIYPLDAFVGDVEVVDLSHITDVITADDIPTLKAPRVIFKTKNSAGDIRVFADDFVALREDAAEKLVAQQMRLVGIDALSIKKKGKKDRVHALLLDAGVVIVEGLWFADVSAGVYELVCLPLPVSGADGAPVRAVLRTKEV